MKLAALIASAGEADGFPAGAIRSLESFPDDLDVPVGYTSLTEEQAATLQEQHAAAVRAWADSKKLDSFREQTSTRLKNELQAFIERRYSDAQQRTLAFQLQAAIAKGETAKAARITQVSEWIAQAIRAYHELRPAVQQASSREDLDALTLDFATLAATDPAVALEEVI